VEFNCLIALSPAEKTYKKVARIEPVVQRKDFPPLPKEQGWESVGGKAKTSEYVASHLLKCISYIDFRLHLSL
jgi:hypothetical protein